VTREDRAQAIALAVPGPALAVQELVWPLVVALATAAAIVPFWAGELLPYQDAPQHLAAVRVLADYHTQGFGFDRWFDLDLGRLEYLGFYLPAAGLSKLVGPIAAVKLMLSLIAIATSAAFWLFLGAFGRDRRLAVLAPAVFHTTPLYLGFFNFVESIPVALVVVALAERELRNPERRRALVLGVAAAGLLWLHPSALAFALACAVVLALTSGLPRRAIARGFAPIVPALILFAAWAVQAIAARDGNTADAHSAPMWMGPRMQVLDLLRFGNVLAGLVDDAFALGLVLLFVAMVAIRPRPRIERGWRVPLLAALTFVAYMAAPFGMGYMAYIHTRALPFLALLVIASPSIASGRKTAILLAAAVGLQIAYQAQLARRYRAFDREAQIAELHEVLTTAEPGKRLIGVLYRTDSRVVQFRAYLHFAAYYEVLRGGRARYNFAETPWTPIRFRKGTEPVPLERGWEVRPLELDLARAVSDEDYVLTRQPAPDPPGFDLLKRAGLWSLYAPAARR
jgi:hypothetical protein